jgi:N-acetylmuramoyl-L-alanine amidase
MRAQTVNVTSSDSDQDPSASEPAATGWGWFVLGAVLLAPVALLVGAFAASRWLTPPPDKPHAYVLHIALPPAGGVLGLPPVQGPLDASRPLVVIDAGHGGHDPGAQSTSAGKPLRERIWRWRWRWRCATVCWRRAG